MAQEGLLQISPPDEIEWNLVLGRQLQNSLVLRNPTKGFVTFKVKTTAPKQYCVRPNSGNIEPEGQQEVLVLLQPLKEFPEGLKCKDKFLVQSVAVEGTEPPSKETVKEIWEQIDAQKKQHEPSPNLSDQKLRCRFIIPPKVKAVPEDKEQSFDGGNERAARSSSSPGSDVSDLKAQYEERLKRELSEKQKLMHEKDALLREQADQEEKHQFLLQEFEKLKRTLQEKDNGLKFRTPGGGVPTADTDARGSSSSGGAVARQQSGGNKQVILLLLVALIFFLIGRVVSG
eukprot:CAMPEP_0114540094 /NCGR_PEP_ID=MMETSP0114-20121206/582_1 /TAXON_ID=31324 /ORGANISM="Goniomonas sp, Strain m" /LENGTH=286 /DNA_ID=CAMNT_0001724229 /DNA_START=15 /DNA_END=875 /DNA_ORIENTATION=+